LPLQISGENYLTAAEAARYLGIARETFYKNVKGRLQPYQHGILKRVYYRQSDLDRLQSIHPIKSEDKDS
jgi:excisionase family DNA binding protein